MEFIAPNEDSILYQGKIAVISWNNTNISDPFSLHLVKYHSGQSLFLLFEDVAEADGELEWRVPWSIIPASSYRLRATTESGQIIEAPPTGFFTIRTPNLTESLLWFLVSSFFG